MKPLDELLNEALFDRELEKVKPQKIDEKAVLEKTLYKLGMASEPHSRYNPTLAAEPFDSDELVYPEPAPPKRRSWRVAAGAAAACLVCAFALFTLVPSAADAIPGLGRLFHAANQGIGTVYNEQNLEWIQAHMQNVADCVSTTQKGDLSFAVKEAYYDGKYLYCVAQIETSLDPNSQDVCWSYRMKIDGKNVDFDYTNLSKPWAKIGENTYVNDGVSFPVPMEYRSEKPGDIQVEYQAEVYNLIDMAQEGEQLHTKFLGRATAAFTAPYDPDGIIEIKTEAEDNGVRLLSFTASPAGTELILDVPGDCWSAGVEAESAGGIAMNHSSEFDSAFSEERRTLIVSGESVPYGEKSVTVSVAGDDRTTARFQVDLENKTVTVGDQTYFQTEKAKEDAVKAEDMPRQWRENFEKRLKKLMESQEVEDKAREMVKEAQEKEVQKQQEQAEIQESENQAKQKAEKRLGKDVTVNSYPVK